MLIQKANPRKMDENQNIEIGDSNRIADAVGGKGEKGV